MVTNDGAGHAVELDDVLKEDARDSSGRVRVPVGSRRTWRICGQPLTLGRPSMKSIPMSAHTVDGIGNGWSRPAGCS
jgi:hypothetical protein